MKSGEGKEQENFFFLLEDKILEVITFNSSWLLTDPSFINTFVSGIRDFQLTLRIGHKSMYTITNALKWIYKQTIIMLIFSLLHNFDKIVFFLGGGVITMFSDRHYLTCQVKIFIIIIIKEQQFGTSINHALLPIIFMFKSSNVYNLKKKNTRN